MKDWKNNIGQNKIRPFSDQMKKRCETGVPLKTGCTHRNERLRYNCKPLLPLRRGRGWSHKYNMIGSRVKPGMTSWENKNPTIPLKTGLSFARKSDFIWEWKLANWKNNIGQNKIRPFPDQFNLRIKMSDLKFQKPTKIRLLEILDLISKFLNKKSPQHCRRLRS